MHENDSGGKPQASASVGIDFPRAHWDYGRTMHLYARCGVEWREASAQAELEYPAVRRMCELLAGRGVV